MIEYAVVTLTDPKDFNSASIIEVQYGTKVVGLCGDMVRNFIRCTNNAYITFPDEDVLAEGLELIPPHARPIVKHLYEEMKDKV